MKFILIVATRASNKQEQIKIKCYKCVKGSFLAKIRVISQSSFAVRSQIWLADGTDPCHHLEMLTEIGAVFKRAQNTFNIKCHSGFMLL